MHAIRRWITLTEALTQRPDWLSGYWYHGTARSKLTFHPTAVAYFTPNRHEAAMLAKGDAEIDGGTPHVIQAKLNIRHPARIDMMLMQDLHFKPDVVATLQAQGYDSAIGEHETEVAVFGNRPIQIEAILDVPLVEAVEGPYTDTDALWHGTDLLSLAAILASDELSKSIDTDDPAGASLTYNERMAWDFADRSSYIFMNNHYHGIIDGSRKEHVLGDQWPHGKPPLTGGVLQFDTDRLRQQYKLVLYRDDEQDDEKEVRVLGDRIHPVSRFLTGFRFVPSDIPWYVAYLQLPHVREDWRDPERVAHFLANLPQHRLFRPA